MLPPTLSPTLSPMLFRAVMENAPQPHAICHAELEFSNAYRRQTWWMMPGRVPVGDAVTPGVFVSADETFGGLLAEHFDGTPVSDLDDNDGRGDFRVLQVVAASAASLQAAGWRLAAEVGWMSFWEPIEPQVVGDNLGMDGFSGMWLASSPAFDALWTPVGRRVMPIFFTDPPAAATVPAVPAAPEPPHDPHVRLMREALDTCENSRHHGGSVVLGELLSRFLIHIGANSVEEVRRTLPAPLLLWVYGCLDGLQNIPYPREAGLAREAKRLLRVTVDGPPDGRFFAFAAGAWARWSPLRASWTAAVAAAAPSF
jgi:hypothetical protein